MERGKRNALFLDRDGILNKLVDNRPPWNPNEIETYEIMHKVIKLSVKNKFIPIIVTNQPDAGRGKLSYELLYYINKIICENFKIKHFYICDHPYDGMCECRKPKPGMLLKASEDLKINLHSSILIGDRHKDIQAGVYAGCKTILLSSKNINISDFHVKDHEELLDFLRKFLRKKNHYL